MDSKSNFAPTGSVSAPASRGTSPLMWVPAVLAAILVVVLIGVLALAVAGWTARQAKTVELNGGQSGSSVELRTGDTLQLALEGNPTTGYTWAPATLDQAILKSAGEPEFQPSSSALGAGGTVTCRFTAVGAGQTTLQMIYSRPFEKDVPPLKTFTVTVTVVGQ